MANIVVFDDDATSLTHIHALVESCAPKGAAPTVLDVHSVSELLQIMAEGTHVDILVTDIMMPEGEPSGIEVVQRLFPPSSGTQVIYVSGSLEQATEVYRTNHLYFLLKPLDPDKLCDALKRAYASLPAKQPVMFHFTVGHKEQLVSVSSIRYLESSLHKVFVHCGKRTYETYARLDDLQSQLPEAFSRCHRSYLVNLAFVQSLTGNDLHLRDGTVIPVSRRRARQVQHDLLTFLSLQKVGTP